MGKYFKTEDICEIIDKKLDRLQKGIMMNTKLEGEELLKEVQGYRILQANLYSLVNDLRDEDDKYDADMAAWRAKKDGTDT